VEAIEFLNGMGSWSEPGHPTLILLDLNLPRKDGRQVLAVIKNNDAFRRIPVVILSSSDSEKDITSCYNLGANCYIVKPTGLLAFRAAVRGLEEFWLGLTTALSPLPSGLRHRAYTRRAIYERFPVRIRAPIPYRSSGQG
jgi:two-component system, chemotaxis family, response regulator Rcp1